MNSSEKSVTLNDVARLAGVSYQTVSWVINNHPSVAEKTRQRVLELIRSIIAQTMPRGVWSQCSSGCFECRF